MAGFLCIAMMKEKPHFITIGVTQYEPDVWAENLLLSSHLLYFEGFSEPLVIEEQYLKFLMSIGIEAKSGKSFKAEPDVVIKALISVRDDIVRPQSYGNLKKIIHHNEEDAFYEKSADSEEAEKEKQEKERLYDQAKEHPFTSEQSFQLYKKSAQLDYQPAYIALAQAYFNGWGVKRNTNDALKWARRSLESVATFTVHERVELGELLRNLAGEYENGSDQVIPDLKRAHELNLQSAELGCELAYTSLACAYLTGAGVEKNLNAALEWSLREIDANIIDGYNRATTCFVEAGMRSQAEQLWKRCFKEQPLGAIATTCLRVYKKQVTDDSIGIDPEIEALFSSLAERLACYQKELGLNLYDDEIVWLGVSDCCVSCHIPISSETARKTDGKCANCFIKEMS